MATTFPVTIPKRVLLPKSSPVMRLASSCLAVTLLLALTGKTRGQVTTEVNVGVVLNMDTFVGKVGWSCICISLSDFYASHPSYRSRLKLNLRDSKHDQVSSAAAVLDLMKNKQVQAIIGPQTSNQADFVIGLGDKANVPIISFSATSPSLNPLWHPYFVRAAQDDSSQVTAIGALVRAFGWREVVLVYVNNEFGQSLMPLLADAMEKVDARIAYRSVISPSSSDSQIQSELYKLSKMQARVYIVHMEPELGSRLFTKAKDSEMMGEGYVWIVTTGITDLFSLIDSRVVTTSMQGVIGVKTHIPGTPALDDFTTRWKMRFLRDYPSVMNPMMNVLGLWAYDAALALAMAVEMVGTGNLSFRDARNATNRSTDFETLAVSENGLELVRALKSLKFPGLAGDFNLVQGQLEPSALEMVNVNGNAARTVGFWTLVEGLHKDLIAANKTASRRHSTSSGNLRTVIWPGDSSTVPKGWEIPIGGKKLKIGVPVKNGFKQFVTVTHLPERNTTEITGYCIDIFKAVLEALPYSVPYEFIPFAYPNGTRAGAYEDLIDQVYYQKYDAVVGDTTIIANRSLYVDFTLPYTESGVSMIVPYVHSRSNDAWVFLKPLRWELWLTTFLFFVMIGMVVWTLEHRINEDFRGPTSQQVGTSFWFSFSTMVFAQRERVMSNLARFVVIIWAFVVLILTQSYTASLSSLLVVQNAKPSMTDFNELLKSGQSVGYQEGSFVQEMLKQMKFDDSRLKSFKTTEECDSLLTNGSANGGIAAAVDEAPYMKLLLSCNKYTSIPTFKTAGFGFVFPRGSPLVPDISRAILNMTEGPVMSEIENQWFPQAASCEDSSPDSNSLSLSSFWGLFLIAGVASLLALLVSIAIFLKRNWHISSGNSFKERMVDLTTQFLQRDMTSQRFRPQGNSVADDRVHEDPNGIGSNSTETENASGEPGTRAADHGVRANVTEERAYTGMVMDIELGSAIREHTAALSSET